MRPQQPTQTQKERRGRTYMKILVVLIIQAIILPWFVMEQRDEGSINSIQSQNAGNPPPSLLKGNWNTNPTKTKANSAADGTFNSYPIYLI